MFFSTLSGPLPAPLTEAARSRLFFPIVTLAVFALVFALASSANAQQRQATVASLDAMPLLFAFQPHRFRACSNKMCAHADDRTFALEQSSDCKHVAS